MGDQVCDAILCTRSNLQIPAHDTLCLLYYDNTLWYEYGGEENAQHLINAIQAEGCKLSTDWSDTKYCGITLQWDWEMRTLTIPMPGYVQKMLARFKHELPPRNQYSSYQPQPKKYGKMRMTQFLSTIYRYWTKNAREWSNK